MSVTLHVDLQHLTYVYKDSIIKHVEHTDEYDKLKLISYT